MRLIALAIFVGLALVAAAIYLRPAEPYRYFNDGSTVWRVDVETGAVAVTTHEVNKWLK
ncbi:MAG: hypothetical protein QNJ98_15665 [Planctomycetota bacterium]|nr:hypothetical protein [Planctomycetota bacterium]